MPRRGEGEPSCRADDGGSTSGSHAESRGATTPSAEPTVNPEAITTAGVPVCDKRAGGVDAISVRPILVAQAHGRALRRELRSAFGRGIERPDSQDWTKRRALLESASRTR